MGTRRTMKIISTTTKMLLQAAFDEFIDEKESANSAPDTIRSYRGVFKQFKTFVDGFDEFDGEDVTCDVIDVGTILKWKTSMLNDGRNPNTINNYLTHMRAFLYWSMDKTYITPRFKIELIKAQQEHFKEFTLEEQKALIDKPQRKKETHFGEWRTWAIVHFVLATGARASTICNIKLEDVDFVKREIILAHTKNKKAQIAAMSPDLYSALKQYMSTADFTGTTYLFPEIGGRKLTTNALRLSFARYCENRGVEKTNIHGLRHSYARSFLLLSGGDSLTLQKALGHSTLEMTKRYANLYHEDIKESLIKYNPLDNLKKGKSRRNKMQGSD